MNEQLSMKGFEPPVKSYIDSNKSNKSKGQKSQKYKDVFIRDVLGIKLRITNRYFDTTYFDNGEAEYVQVYAENDKVGYVTFRTYSGVVVKQFKNLPHPLQTPFTGTFTEQPGQHPDRKHYVFIHQASTEESRKGSG